MELECPNCNGVGSVWTGSTRDVIGHPGVPCGVCLSTGRVQGPEWRDIPGFEGRYQVSDDGKVRSLLCGTKNGDTVERSEPRLMRPKSNHDGYLQVTLYNAGSRTTRFVHRLLLEAFRGPCPAGFESSHLDGSRTNNVLSNLIWESKKDNNARRIEHGTQTRGESVPSHVLTDNDVVYFRSEQRLLARRLANQRGVDISTVLAVLEGKTWTHVP